MDVVIAHPNGIAIRGTPIEAADVVVAVVLKVADIDEVPDVEGTARGGKVRRRDQGQDFGGYRINAAGAGGNLVIGEGIAGANTVADAVNHSCVGDAVGSTSGSGEITVPLAGRRNVCLIETAAANAGALIIEEEKRLVLN